MDNDWKSSGHGTLSEQESGARQLFFAHVFSWCAVQFPFRYWLQLFMFQSEFLLGSHCYFLIFLMTPAVSFKRLTAGVMRKRSISCSCWYHFHVVHIAVMCKTYLYKKWNMDFLFFSISKPKLYSPIPCLFPFMFHLTCICKLAVLPQMISLFWWFLYCDYFDLSTFVSSLPFLQSLFASCHYFLPCSTHTYTPFSNTIMNMIEWLKSKNLYNVTTDWWKLVKKAG